MIPKILHFIWLGSKPPDWVQANIAQAVKLHPGWQVHLWTKIPSDMPVKYRMVIRECSFLCQQADVFRYWLLYEYGGIYLDTDEYILRCMEDLRRYPAFICRQKDRRIAIGAIGAQPRHLSIQYLLAGVEKRYLRWKGKELPRILFGPDLTGDLEKAITGAGMKVLPFFAFYPNPKRDECHAFWHADDVGKQKWLKQYGNQIIYGVHLWGVDGSSTQPNISITTQEIRSRPLRRKDYCFVVGGGPSLLGFNFTRLVGQDTITVNKSLFDVPDSLIWVTTDGSFYRRIKGPEKEVFISSKVYRIFIAGKPWLMLNNMTTRKQIPLSPILHTEVFDEIIPSHRINGIGLTWEDFVNGKNSGFSGLQLALLMGYKKIYLLGMDMVVTPQTHYHEGYGITKVARQIVSFIPQWEEGIRAIKEVYSDRQVISCSSISVLNQWLSYCAFEDIPELKT